LTISASAAGWIEYALLRRGLNRRIGHTGHSNRLLASLWCAAGAAAVIAFGVKLLLGTGRPLLAGLAVLGFYAGVYLLLTLLWRVPEATAVVERLRRRRSPRPGRP
jgi:putative peptidoglycan lipid II flippase